MLPDELRECETYSGTGTLLADESGEEFAVSYKIQVYDVMGWTGDGEPRVKMRREIHGRVWVPGDLHWARRCSGRSFVLRFKDGKRRLHLFVKDDTGRIANHDSRGIYE